MTKLLYSVVILALASATVRGDEITQAGSLSGSVGGPTSHDIVLDQFDDLGGLRVLNFVRIDLLTSTVGGGTTTGSGVPVNVSVQLSADYFLGPQGLAQTEAVIDLDVANTGTPGSFSVFDSDTAEVLIDRPGDLTRWIGPGEIGLTGITEFQIALTPPDEIRFSAGGTVNYTVTYDFQTAAAVPTLPVWSFLALVGVLATIGSRVIALRARSES